MNYCKEGSRIHYIFFIGVFLLVPLLASLAESASNDSIPSLEDRVGQANELIEQRRWEYLGQEWRTILLKNEFIASIDSFLTKISVVFEVLIGEPYQLSLRFIAIFFFFLYFGAALAELVLVFSPFTRSVAYLAAVGLSIILAHLGFMRTIIDIIFKVLFYKTGPWPWIFAIIFLGMFIFLFLFVKIILKRRIMEIAASAATQQRADQRLLHRVIMRLKGGLS